MMSTTREGGTMLTTLMAVMMASTAPTVGDLYRELATDPAAFDRADRDGNGRVDDVEFDAYKRARRRGEAVEGASGAALGGYDLNNDGALTPFELYPEADYELETPAVEFVDEEEDDEYED